jgi:hypothetical protein
MATSLTIPLQRPDWSASLGKYQNHDRIRMPCGQESGLAGRGVPIEAGDAWKL